MSIIGSNILAGSSGQGGGGYTIENSLRFRSSASAYLSRTFASAGNRKTWTWSAWVKRGKLGVDTNFMLEANSGNGYNRSYNYFNTSDQLNIGDYGSSWNWQLKTTQVFRDVGAWYHIVVLVDTTQATSSDRVKLYINGEQVTSFAASTYPSLNYTTYINTTYQHTIGYIGYAGQRYFDGYMTEVNFIDGEALDPSSFGEYNEDTGVWQPVAYSGSYGTNGFYLPFSDNTNTTTLVADSSGNGNDWTPNNISLTSGVTYDSMTDTPTPYAGGGNYAVMNPLMGSTSVALSNANLKVTSTDADFNVSYSSIGITSGKWYAEFSLDYLNTTTNTAQLGVGSYVYPRDSSNMTGFVNGVTGINLDNSSSSQRAVFVDATLLSGGDSGFSFVNGDVVGIALDADAGQVTFYKNGSVLGATYPYTATLLSGSAYYFMTVARYTTSFSANFGQRPFAYTPPTGFLPLHTGNLPDSAIVDGSEYFNAVTWSGDNTSPRAISTVGFQSDLVWIKSRSNGTAHVLFDAIRGSGETLTSNSTDSEITNSQFGYVSAFNSDGFSLTAGTYPGYESGDTNMTGRTYVGWNWKANGAGVSNDDGSITSTVSANATAGFSVVTYTANGASAQTIGHGLNAVPAMIITKVRNNAGGNWGVYHKSVGNTGALFLNIPNGTGTSSLYWNNTTPTSSVFSVGSNNTDTNWSTYNFVAYCFAEVEGYSKFGSYTGNGITDGPFIYCGFKPRYIVIKGSTVATSWYAFDTARSTYNEDIIALNPDNSNSEASALSTYGIDILSNGFKIRQPAGYGLNNSGQTYIYAAFAENPFKNSLAR